MKKALAAALVGGSCLIFTANHGWQEAYFLPRDSVEPSTAALEGAARNSLNSTNPIKPTNLVNPAGPDGQRLGRDPFQPPSGFSRQEPAELSAKPPPLPLQSDRNSTSREISPTEAASSAKKATTEVKQPEQGVQYTAAAMYRVTAIVTTGSSQAAVIATGAASQLYFLGDPIGSYTLAEIGDQAVTLTGPEGTLVLTVGN